MAASMEELKLSNLEQKMNKKLNHPKQLLFKQEKIKTTSKITNLLCVYNGGVSSEEDIHRVFKEYGNIIDIIMIPQKAYCFVLYKTKEEAERAVCNLNGYCIKPGDSENNLCLFYVSQVPPSIGPSSFLPPGLVVIPDFITEEEEKELLKLADWQKVTEEEEKELLKLADWHDEADQALKPSEVKHYGYEFKFDSNNVKSSCPLDDKMPTICDKLLIKVKDTGVVNYIPDQLTVSHYEPGQGMPLNVYSKKVFEDGIISLSLGSQVVMEFHHPDGDHRSVLLPGRCLFVMTGQSRYIWSHGIASRTSDIILTADGQFTSVKRQHTTVFTFRKISQQKDEGSPIQSNEQQQALPVTEQEAVKLEQLHVHQVYDNIADHFSSTRHSPWPQITQFITSQPSASIMADIGCGNGKYLGINKSIYSIGSDRSKSLVSICKDRLYEGIVSDIMSIPLRSNSLDVVLCIAVIHHLSTQERRQEAIRELVRTLRSKGQALIYVWALEQKRNKVKSKYLKQNKSGAAVSDNSLIDSINDNSPTDLNSSVESECMHDANLPTNDLKSSVESGCIRENNLPSEYGTTSSSNCDNTNQTQVENKTMDKNDDNVTSDKKREKLVDKKYDNTHDLVKNNPSRHSDITNRHTPSSSASSVQKQSKNINVHVNRTEFQDQDMFVPWQLKNKSVQSTNDSSTYHRFYHVFREGELEELCCQVNDCQIVKSYYDQGNWCVIIQKL